MNARWILPLWVMAACGGDDGGGDDGSSVDCSLFPQELLEQWGFDAQLALNLSLANGDNYASIRDSTGLPDPASFRDLADAFDAADFSGIDPLAFDPPAEVADDLRTTGDLLEGALAAGEDLADPAWADFSAFFTSDQFVQTGSSVSYHLDEAGCDATQ